MCVCVCMHVCASVCMPGRGLLIQELLPQPICIGRRHFCCFLFCVGRWTPLMVDLKGEAEVELTDWVGGTVGWVECWRLERVFV